MGTGWGSCMRSAGQEASGLWESKAIRYKSSNFRELLAVLRAVKSFAHLLKGKVVQVLSDNVTTVAYINHMGGQDWLLSTLTTTIFAECHDLKIQISTKFLAGKQN